MKKLKYFLSLLVLSFLIITGLMFATAFLAFGLEEEELLNYSIRRFFYGVFLIFRFPSHYIPSLRTTLPSIHHQLAFNSLLYASMITVVTYGVQMVKRS